MKKYNIKLTEEAKQERKSLAHFIKDEVHAPLTAKRYMLGLEEEIKKLENSAGSLAVDEELSRQLGMEVRRTNYKNMAIIFSVEEENAYIHHIIPQKMVVFEVEI
ncbi:MAG: type II toxin-antitoxin system RelE/ParE family toxin [Paludibacteraceae bacterium]|jgi:plasmid stabilization system protein ParE|nr:type II toxin-antitoxin system RelE/ParE family toxin [Paludibacteraceae bacterium]